MTDNQPEAPQAAEDAPEPEAPKAEETDWEAKYREAIGHSREWEKRAKDNKGAAEKLQKLEAASMSETEKAVAAAKAEGAAEVQRAYGLRLAAAELKAAAAAQGVNLDDLGDLIDVSRLLGEDGEVDPKAVKAAVARFAKLAPKPGPSGGDFGGAPQQQPASLDAQIRKAESEGDFVTARQLKTQKMFNR